MAVNIDPSEVRNAAAALQPGTRPRLRLPMRTVLTGSLGGAGLLAFSVGAFSFFSTLADPRARAPRPMQAAASMPDLKDGMPALVGSEVVVATRKAEPFDLPRPNASEPAVPQPSVVTEQAAASASVESTPAAQAEPRDAAPPALRTGPTPPQIQNAATLPETRTVAVIAPPPRTAATIAPARTETVKAKPVQASAVSAVSAREPVEEPASTATAQAISAQPSRKDMATKPAAVKTTARKAASVKTVAEAEPAAATVPAATGSASEDSDIPGARQFRAGVKAIGALFDGDARDD